MELIPLARQYSMVAEKRMINLIHQIDYVVSNNIDGAVVECGVWKGGTICLARSYLKQKNITRNVYAFDSFEGLPIPTAEDYIIDSGILASDVCGKPDDTNKNCYSSIDTFYETMKAFSLETHDIIIRKGWFEDTTKNFPESIAILRFDGDFYKSTLDVLNNLYSKVSSGGILIFDDYGYWNGNKQAVDEFILQHKLSPVIHKTDDAEVWFIKE